MTLHEAIRDILRESNSPLTAKQIASNINLKKNYIRTDGKPIDSGQISSRIRKYSNMFQNINGQVILIEDVKWKNLLTSYWYLINLLNGIFIFPDIQFIISVLLFYKRLSDINDRANRKIPFDFFVGFDNEINRLIDGGDSWINDMKVLEHYHVGPAEIFDECSRLLSKVDSFKKQEIWSILKNLETTKYDDVSFGNIYEHLLNLDPIDGYKATIYTTPYSLRELMIDLLEPKAGKLIYDPVCGTGGLLVQATNNYQIKIKGTEINKRIAQLGNMNLIMHGLYEISITAKDCFDEINNENKYDYIIADLPANGITNSVEHYMLYKHWGLEPPKSGKGFGSLVLFVLSKLKYSGRAILTVADSFLMKKGKEKEIRDLMINNDIIESIISLPYGTLRPYTDAKASLIILNNEKPLKLKNQIRFITGRAIDQDKKSLDLNNDIILNLSKSTSLYSIDTQIVDTSSLRSDSNLTAEAYDAQFMLGSLMQREGSGQLLSKLVEIKSGFQPYKNDLEKNGDIPLIKIENLSRNVFDIGLSKESNTNTVQFSPHYQRAIISEMCILIARIGDYLKPTLFRPELDRPQIMIHTGIYALIPSKSNDIIDLEYLYYQLHSSFVLEQIKQRKLGAVMPFISIASLNQIVIPYVELKSQHKFVDSQRANIIAEERARVEEKIKALGYKEKVTETESDIVRTLVHQLRPTLLNIDLEVNKLKRIVDNNYLSDFKENVGNLDDIEDIEIADYIKVVPNYTLKEILEKIKEDTLRLNEVLSIVNKVMSFKLSPEDMKPVDLLIFFQEYLYSKKIDINERFQVEVSGEQFDVELNKASFKELIDQLLLNAESHGFKESKIPINKRQIQFTIRRSKERSVAIINYQNNGSPFNLSQNDFIKPFHKSQKSTGSGIGGNYIYRIIHSHGGDLIVRDGGKSGFSMTIEIPIIQNKENE